MTPNELALLQRLADEVHSIAQDWPEVRNAISRIDARLNEHERRIHRVESSVMTAHRPKSGPPPTSTPSLLELGEITENGTRVAYTMEQIETMQAARSWRRSMSVAEKVGGTVLAAIVLAVLGVVAVATIHSAYGTPRVDPPTISR